MANGVEEIISTLYEMVRDAWGLPLGAEKCVIERDKVLDLLDELHRQGMTIIVVTHELDVGKRADRIINIIDGQVFTGKSEYQENGKTK